MKKIIIMAAFGIALASLTGCKQNEDPKYKDPTHFTVNTPALQDQVLQTVDDMTNPATFNLFCSQPDYGYAAIANYAAYVSLDPNCPTDEEALKANKSILLENTNPTSAAMSFKLFNLALAANKMSGVSDEMQYALSPLAQGPIKMYFRAVAEIPGIEGSRIVSDNVVSYNQVKAVYAVLKPGWIYICGNVASEDGGTVQSFLAPAPGNAKDFEPFMLWEPEDLAGEKLYVGHFQIPPKDNGAEVDNPDAASQFRFFTELLGWVPTASLGSNEADFYCMPITNDIKNGATCTKEIIPQGLGNWGIHCTSNTPVTMVVDVTGLNLYVVEGTKTVTFDGRTPSFN